MRRQGSGRETGRGQGRGRGPGRLGGPLAAGPGGSCVCLKCGHKEEHQAGKPCNKQKCPQCGTQLTRE